MPGKVSSNPEEVEILNSGMRRILFPLKSPARLDVFVTGIVVFFRRLHRV